MYDNNVIVGGDFNTVDNIKDRLSGKTDASSSNFSKFKKYLNITDSWRSLHQNEKGFPFTDCSSRTAMSRIDYIFCNENLSKCLHEAYGKVAPVPDHKAVVIHLRSSKTSRDQANGNLTVLLSEKMNLKLALNTYLTRLHKSRSSRSELEFDLSNFV